LDCESGEGRDKLFKYTIDTYGIEKCAAVSTFGIRKARSAIRDVGRLYGIDLKEIDTIAKLIPQVYYIEGTEDKKTDLSIKESLEYIPELKEWQKKYPDLFDMAMKLENLPSHMSIHAAGTLIADTDIIDVAPMIRQVDKELNATSLDLHAAESQKLVKYDYLGLNTLNIISECEKLTGDIFDIEFDNYDDEEVWKLISSRNTTGLFQIGSNTYKSRMYKLKPNSIEELANCLALVRGPCISSKLDQKYINVLNGKEDIELIHPMYDSVVKDTCGIMIYQEQLMAVCSNMGLPLHEGYDLMKASAKKKFDKIKTYEEKLHSLVRNSMDDETFNYIFKLILDSGKYSFNKSHAIAYATICYITAYYKVHHIKEFIAATLTCNYNNKSGKTEEKKRKLYELYLDAVSNGVKFLPLDLKKSKWNFTVEGDKIRIGFCALAGFSKAALNEIYDKMPEASDEPLVKQIHDNVEKRICSKKAMIPLILSGAIGDPVENYEYYCELRKEEPQSDIKISKDLILQPYAPQAEVEEVLYRVAYTENKFNTLPRINLDDIKINNNYTTEGYIQKVSKKKDSRGNEMAFIDVLTGDGLVSLVVFANVYKTYKSKLKKDNKIKFKAVKQKHTHKFIKATVM
jgi:DNA polymerase-3 subunit alpha